MSSPRRLFYLYCLVLSIRLGSSEEAPNSPIVPMGHKTAVSSSKIPPSSKDTSKDNCSCGGFPSATPEVNSVPMLSQMPGLLVNCDDEGISTCKSLCLALATATKAKGPEILCNRLKVADELKLSAFYKVCYKPWTYAGMTADEALCCEDSKVKPCASAGVGHSTVGIEVKMV